MNAFFFPASLIDVPKSNAVYDEIGCVEIPHRRIGRAIRLSRAALVRWLAGSCGAASTKGQ